MNATESIVLEQTSTFVCDWCYECCISSLRHGCLNLLWGVGVDAVSGPGSPFAARAH